MKYDIEKCESIAEKEFVHTLVKFLDCKMYQQYKIKTKHGSFRIDFVLEKDNKKYGIEVDGKQHEKNVQYDTDRDYLILKEKHLDGIFRVPAWLCLYFRFAPIYYIACYISYFFDSQRLDCLLYSESIKDISVKKDYLYITDYENKEYEVRCFYKGKQT